MTETKYVVQYWDYELGKWVNKDKYLDVYDALLAANKENSSRMDHYRVVKEITTIIGTIWEIQQCGGHNKAYLSHTLNQLAYDWEDKVAIVAILNKHPECKTRGITYEIRNAVTTKIEEL